MTGKRVLLLVICILLALSTAAMFTACDDKPSAPQTKGAVYEEFYTPTKNKAMILIPGLMASSLYKLDDGKPVWGVDGFLNLADEYSKSLDSINRQYPDGSDPSSPNHEEYSKKIARALQDIIVKYLSCDEDGTPVTALRVANMHSSEKFGSFEGMGYLFDILFKNYRNQYDIIVWQYDWRDSNVKAASQLERFINQCGYEKVQFYTHSMGGIVVANYLKSAANREKVELFMPFGAPFLGSMDAVSNLFSSAAFDALKDFDFLFGDVDLTEVTRSMPSIYELLPFPQYFTTPTYDGGNSPIFIEDEAVTYERFYEYLCSLDWTKKSDGSLKPFVKGLLDYQSGFFKKASYDSASKRYYEDPNGQYTVHVTQLVPTEYIVGVGVPTIVNVGIVDGELDPDGYGYDYTEFDARGSIYERFIGSIVRSGKTNGSMDWTTGIFESAGDGTVPAYSASAGLSLESDNVHLVYGILHGPLANDSDNLMGFTPGYLTGLAYVEDLVAKYIKYTDDELALRSERDLTGKTDGNIGAVSAEKPHYSKDPGFITSTVFFSLMLAGLLAYIIFNTLKKTGKLNSIKQKQVEKKLKKEQNQSENLQ